MVYDEYLNFLGQLTGRNSSLDDWPRVWYMHEYIGGMFDMLRYLYFLLSIEDFT